MMQFIGTKIIRARPMNRREYNEYRNWALPGDEDGDDPGYLVEYMDGGKPNHPNHQGYVSWSPVEQFEKAYRQTNGLTFGLALEALKLGKKVARAGWNGKGMWLSMSGPVTGSLVPSEKFWSLNNLDYAKGVEKTGKAVKVLPSITMKTADGDILMGWLASQTDMFAEDWIII